MKHLLVPFLVATTALGSEAPNRGIPFKQPPLNAWPNPSTERDGVNGQGWSDSNGGYMTCDDDLGWKYGNTARKNVDVDTYLQSPQGKHCHCPRSGRWAGKLTNGTWYWDYAAEDWDVTPGVDGHAAYAAGRGIMSATAIWEFWSTVNGEAPKDFDTSDDLRSKAAVEGERFWVSQEVTIWGQPARGAEWVDETGDFQSSKKFAELNAQGKVMKDPATGKILYKGSSISLVYECQTLYTDTLAPDRRDQGCQDGHCGGSNSGNSGNSGNSKANVAEEEVRPPVAGEEDVKTPGPAPGLQYPHKMAWFMFLTASSGPASVRNPDFTYQTCDDVNSDAKCPNRPNRPGGSDYKWMPGVNTCLNSFKKPFQGFSSTSHANQPLCPDCIPSTQYLGYDGGGVQPNSQHPELAQQSANDIQNGLPPCATQGNPDEEKEPWENDYFSMCDFPFVSSAMALPVNGLYENNASKTFHWNGTITAGPPQDNLGGENADHIDAKAQLPGYPGPIHTDSAYTGIAGPANSMILCDGVFDHCTSSTSGDNQDCAYGHTKNFLQSLNGNKQNAGGKLGNVPYLVDPTSSSPQTFATLVCVRNSWVKGRGYDKTQADSSTFLQNGCQDTTDGHSQWLPGSGGGGTVNDQPTACMKGGGFGWPYCPLNLPNAPAIDDQPPVFCWSEPQGAGQLAAHKYYYLQCLSARLLPILDGLGGQQPDMSPMFWAIGAAIFSGFAGLWLLFFVSIHKSEDEQDTESAEESRLVGLSSRFVQQQEVLNAQAVRRLKCGSCASPLDIRPVPKFCPFCQAPSTGYMMYEPRAGNWVAATSQYTGR